MSSELAVMEQQQQVQSFEWTPEKTQLLKDTICKGASDEELRLFAEVCKSKKLDPFSKQIYAMKRYDSTLRRETITFQTGIDGFRTLAQRTGHYAGQDAPEWCGDDGQWVDVWLKDQAPAAARVSVYRHGFVKPTCRVALYREYLQTDREGKPNSMWRKMPANQLAKCAEALALRAAFPEELSGLYTSDEMGQADNYTPTTEEARKEVIARRLKETAATPSSEEEPTREQFEAIVKAAKVPQLNFIMVKLNERFIQHCGGEVPASLQQLALINDAKAGAKHWRDLDENQRKAVALAMFDKLQEPMPAAEMQQARKAIEQLCREVETAEKQQVEV